MQHANKIWLTPDSVTTKWTQNGKQTIVVAPHSLDKAQSHMTAALSCARKAMLFCSWSLNQSLAQCKHRVLLCSKITGTSSNKNSHAMDTLWQYQFRIILLGDSTVGKSSLLKRFTDGIYSDVADPTVGVDFYARSLDIEPGVKIKLQLWDTAGQERFRWAVLPIFFPPICQLLSNR